MKQCSQTLCFQLKCNSCEREEPLPAHKTEKQHIRQDIYSKFAETLEVELRKQHQKYTTEVDELSNQVFNLKNTVLRLEIRNKKDNEAHQQLRRQYNLLLQKIKDKEPRIIKQVEFIERIKEVPAQVNNEDLLSELRHWKSKAEEGIIQFQKMRMDKDLANEQITNLKDQIQRMKRKLSKQQSDIQYLKRTIEDKDRTIEKLNNHIVFLKSNKEVIFETKYLFPEFKPPEKVRTETKVQTIYVEKPVERPVFVEIEKRVKEFVQPERPVVNRIINCSQERSCQCQEQQYAIMGYKAQIGKLQTYIDQLENNITSYKSQRQHLVDVIGSKNSELNYLEAKMRLFGNNGAPAPSNKRSTVDVFVSKRKETIPTNEKIQPKPEKYPTKK